jgi:hypothetical protein
MVAANCQTRDLEVLPESTEIVPIVGPDAIQLANAPSIQLQEVTWIDGNAADNAFSHIPAVAVSRTGDLFVVDQGSSTIKVYDATGQAVRSIGRTGDGPGELRSPSHMAIGEDTVFVVDQHGLNRFLLDGEFIDRVAIQNPPYLQGRNRGYLHPQSLHATVRGLLVSFLLRAAARENHVVRDTTTIHILDSATGASGTTIARMVSSERIAIGSSVSSRPWFAVSPSFTVSPAGTIFITHQDGAHIDVIPVGSESVVRRIRLGAERRRVTTRDLARVKDLTVDAIRSFGRAPTNPQEWESRLRSLPHAEYWPVVGRLLAGADGALLIERPDLNPDYGAPRNTTRWSLIAPDERIVGYLSLGPGVTPMALMRTTLVAVSRDSLDVPSVLRYELNLTSTAATVTSGDPGR